MVTTNGRMRVENVANTTVRYVRFVGNSAEYGGALHVSDASLFISHSTISRNVAVEREGTGGLGGGLYARCEAGCEGLRIAVSFVRFDGNVAGQDGGAIWLQGIALDLAHTSFVRNRALGYGGAVFVEGANQELSVMMAVANFTENTAAEDGGGVCARGDGYCT